MRVFSENPNAPGVYENWQEGPSADLSDGLQEPKPILFRMTFCVGFINWLIEYTSVAINLCLAIFL